MYFANGVIDFDGNELRRSDFETTIVVPRDVSMARNETVRAEIYARILDPIFTVRDDNPERAQLRDYWLKKTARAISGQYLDKEWVVMEGLRNCGKGVLIDLLRHTFGKYVGGTNTENFYSSRGGGQDEAKKRSWMLDFEFRRICAMNECGLETSGGATLCGNSIKQFTSGGDEISARKNYQDETVFMIQATPFLCVNDMPSVRPTDALQRCVPFNFTSKFVRATEKAVWEKRGLDGVYLYPADDDVKQDFIRRSDVQNEFVLMLLDAFHGNAAYPPKLRILAQSDQADDIGDLLDMYIIVRDDPSSFVSNEDLRMVLDEMGSGLTQRKACRILKAKGAKAEKKRGKRGLACLTLAVQMI